MKERSHFGIRDGEAIAPFGYFGGKGRSLWEKQKTATSEQLVSSTHSIAHQ